MKFEEIDRTVFEEETRKFTDEQLGQKYQVHERSIRRWKTVLGISDGNNAKRKTNGLIPRSITPIWDKHKVIESKRCMVLNDIEAPDHNVEILELARKVAIEYQIQDLILDGDAIAFDSFSPWAKSTDYNPTFEEEMRPIEEILAVFCDVIPGRKIWTSGNHERRLPLMVGGKFNISRILKNDLNIEFSEYSHCILNPGKDQWYIVHQKEYSRIPLSATRRIFAVQLCNTLTAHSHHQGFCKDPSGRYWLVEGGSCRDPLHTKYKNVRQTSHPSWNLGFSLIINGQPLLINLENQGWLDRFEVK